MLPSKFGVNWPFGPGEEAKNRFSRWRPWRPSWISDRHDFSSFWSTSHPDASYQVSSQLAQGCRRNRLLKQLLTPHDGQWLTTIAHHEHFVLRWANKQDKFYTLLIWAWKTFYNLRILSAGCSMCSLGFRCWVDYTFTDIMASWMLVPSSFVFFHTVKIKCSGYSKCNLTCDSCTNLEKLL